MKPFDESGAYVAVAESGTLRQLAVRGAGITVIAQGLAFAVHLISTVILARLLTPGDFGVVTMVTTFSVLLASCGQIGFPDAVLQRDEMTESLASNLFWINIAIGLALAFGFAASGSLLAKFYKDARVSHVAIGMSLTILITSASVLHVALLKRAMCFSAVSMNDIVSRGAAVAVSLPLAWAGWGYWALVAGAVAQPLSMTIGAWVLCRWVPRLPSKGDGVGSVLRFARDVFGRWTVGYFTQNTDNLLVGWRFGSGPLGFYKKAYDLFVLPFSLLTVYPVAVSTLSRLKHDGAQYRRYFLGGLSILAFIGMGVGANLTLVGKDLIRFMLGPQWAMTGRIFMFFGPGIGAMLIYSTNGMIHLSLGTTGRYFRWGIAEVTTACLLFFLGLHWGPSGVATAWTLSYWILTLPAFWYAGKPIQLGMRSIIATIWRYLIASLIAGCVCAAGVRFVPFLFESAGAIGSLYHIIKVSLLFGSLYVALVVALHRSWAPILQVTRVLADLIPRKIPQSPLSAIPLNDGAAILVPTRD